jgi:hypothetical protein
MLALVLALWSAPEPPPDDGVRVQWSAPTGCPTEAELRASVEALLGGPIDAPGRDAIAIDGTITGAGDRWTLALSVASSSGTRVRELPGTDCVALTEVASVLVAVAIDPALDPEADPPPPEPVAAKPTPTPVPPPAAPRPAPPPRERVVTGAIGVRGGVGFGPLPRVAGSLAIDGAMLVRRARIEASANMWLPSETRTTQPASGTIRLWHVDVRGCGVPRVARRRVELPLCAGVQLGAMSGRSHGVARPRLGRLPWIALEGAVGIIVLPTPRVGIRLDVRGAAALVQPGFSVDGEQLHRARPGAIASTLGLELRLP